MALCNMKAADQHGLMRFFNENQNNGVLGKRELAAILLDFNIRATGEELQQMIDMVSVDGRGIGLQAFLGYMSTATALRDQDQEYAEAFRVFDRNGDGTLSRDEIRYVMSKFGMGIRSKRMHRLIDQADANKDGVIQYEEFVELMKKKGY